MDKQTTEQMKAQHGYDVKQDGRYSTALEWCGHPEQRYVARFCGEFIGSYDDHGKAVARCDKHHTDMLSPAL